jgi:diacylglycerol O-acyltransferase / wax synthase
VCEDTRQAVRDLPDIRRAVGAAARLGLRSRRSGTVPVATPPAVPGLPDERITVPMAMIFVDADEWDARAQSLGGTSNTLLAALAARLAQRVGFGGPDGSVTLAMPVNERVAGVGDARANPVRSVDITVDAALATTDLREVRAATKQALIRHGEVPDEAGAVLPLVPLVPKQLATRMLLGVAAGGATNVVSSNLGAVSPAANRADGTHADYFAMQAHFPGVTTAMVHSAGGRLALLSGRAHGRVFVSILAYQPGRRNTNDELRHDVSSTLTDFPLTATTGWGEPVRSASGRV